ncbi:hypothetical protein A0J61_05230 [Choanephora cucurbitarum]|uniref:Uncharacterized protein n=1 Tax=Choanephora cucurbitarum TaxID=101091 RepID=A0A1C7NH76_9FUNG|nr:hypothetical protein A0J61_05230 [Choanephora cucurbitarum]
MKFIIFHPLRSSMLPYNQNVRTIQDTVAYEKRRDAKHVRMKEHLKRHYRQERRWLKQQKGINYTNNCAFENEYGFNAYGSWSSSLKLPKEVSFLQQRQLLHACKSNSILLYVYIREMMQEEVPKRPNRTNPTKSERTVIGLNGQKGFSIRSVPRSFVQIDCVSKWEFFIVTAKQQQQKKKD